MIFEERESQVRSYSRSFPTVFAKAKKDKLWDENGREYIDFFAGAGVINYGHNNDYIKEKVLDYFGSDFLIHGLDMFSIAKRDFLETFTKEILEPRGLDYRVAFTGPTGTNAVEAALKLARKVTGRSNVIAFSGSFHGMTMGSASLSSGVDFRKALGTQTTGTTFMPFPTGFFTTFDTIRYMDEMLKDDHSGLDMPAAIIVETTQCEGGIYTAPNEWLVALRELCDKYGIILIIDDIQTGCGRCGSFFSFERAGIKPDLVTVSKSISGYGMPMALLLIKPEYDIWSPGEHNGTFRGFQPAFVAAKAALEYRASYDLDAETNRKGSLVKEFVEKEILPLSDIFELRGLGLLWGIDVHDGAKSKAVAVEAFNLGVIMERSGRNDEVLKIMPPLVVEDETLLKGLQIIKQAIINVYGF
ncbi:MAG: diaminobutyrate--2-oxoglutarate transaminase [Anaerofustis stercorihominis]|nr:diaminobutyrate--2-oxoglutarate transaminase [Anaerofustis stercorihominis]